jgi:hypothetical protein
MRGEKPKVIIIKGKTLIRGICGSTGHIWYEPINSLIEGFLTNERRKAKSNNNKRKKSKVK